MESIFEEFTGETPQEVFVKIEDYVTEKTTEIKTSQGRIISISHSLATYSFIKELNIELTHGSVIILWEK